MGKSGWENAGGEVENFRGRGTGRARGQRLMTVGRMQNVVKSLAKRSDAQVDCWVVGLVVMASQRNWNWIPAGGGVGLRPLILRISRFYNWLKVKVCQSQVSSHLLTNAASRQPDQAQLLKSLVAEIPIMGECFACISHGREGKLN